MDRGKLEKFTDRIMSDVNASMSCLNLYIGHRLGLFKALQVLGPTDPARLSGYSNTNERYIKEWLECLSAGAGFSKFEILPVENDFWRFYQLKH